MSPVAPSLLDHRVLHKRRGSNRSSMRNGPSARREGFERFPISALLVLGREIVGKEREDVLQRLEFTCSRRIMVVVSI